MLSLAAAQRFIAARYGARAGTLAPLAAGEWSVAYAFTLDGREAVVRFGRHGEDYAKDRAMAAFTSAPLPIPGVLETGPTPDGAFAVSERVRGVALDGLGEAGMLAVLPALLRALDAARAIDVRGRPGYGNWRPDGSAPHPSWRRALLDIADEDRLPGWRRALAGSPTGSAPFDAGLARLTALAADIPDVKEVIHSDLLYRNVLVQGTEVRAVIDWGNSLYGDALYDAAWLMYWWPWYPAWRRIDIRARLQRHWAATRGVPDDLERRLLCYRLQIGLCAMAYNAFTARWDDLAANAAEVGRLAALAG